MIDDDFKYVLDKNGQRVLVGLTPSETVEFERLDSLGATIRQDSHLFQLKETLRRLGEKDGSNSSKGTSSHDRL
jgi:hypothetical protein